MGIDLSTAPDTFLNKLFPDDRRRKGVQTSAEALSKYERREERKIHVQFRGWLGLRQIPFVEPRMDRESTIAEGHPDFTILFNNFNLLVELKAPGGRLSEVQKKRIDELRRAGNKVVICYSFEEAIRETKKHFDL